MILHFSLCVLRHVSTGCHHICGCGRFVGFNQPTLFVYHSIFYHTNDELFRHHYIIYTVTRLWSVFLVHREHVCGSPGQNCSLDRCTYLCIPTHWPGTGLLITFIIIYILVVRARSYIVHFFMALLMLVTYKHHVS
jgi:hypothetical protein